MGVMNVNKQHLPLLPLLLESTQSHKTPHKATKNHTKPQKTTQSHKKPHKATKNHTKPQKTAQSHAKLTCNLVVKMFQNYFKTHVTLLIFADATVFIALSNVLRERQWMSAFEAITTPSHTKLVAQRMWQ